MKLTSTLIAAAMTLSACQMAPDQTAPVAARVQEASQRGQVREAQTALRQLGYYRNSIDGIVGPRTSAAVQRARADLGLTPTGTIDNELLDIMKRYLTLNPPQKGIAPAADVFAAQRGLKRLGYYDGRIYGLYDRATLAAVLAYRRKSGLPITEKIDRMLLRQIDGDTILGMRPASPTLRIF